MWSVYLIFCPSPVLLFYFSSEALFLNLEFNFLNLICPSLRQSYHLVVCFFFKHQLILYWNVIPAHRSQNTSLFWSLYPLSSSAALLYSAYHCIYSFFVYFLCRQGPCMCHFCDPCDVFATQSTSNKCIWNLRVNKHPRWWRMPSDHSYLCRD